MNTCLIVVLVSVIVAYQTCRGDYQEDTWQEPNAWDRHAQSGLTLNTCPVCDAVEDGALAAFYYKKLITNLFNKNVLKENEYNDKLQRTVRFFVSPAQLETIATSTDLRDLDAVITAILTTAKSADGAFPTKENKSYFWLTRDLLQDFLQISRKALSNPEVSFVLLVIGVMLLIWFINKRYKKNVIAIVVIGLLLFGYFHTYIECNRKLEAEKYIDFIGESKPEEQGLLSKIFSSIFRTTKRDEHIQKIKKQTKINLPYCRPDHVLIMYFNDIFLNQFQFMIEKCVDMLITLKNLPFPYNIGAMLAVPFLFMGILRLIFKHFLNPLVWCKIMFASSKHKKSEKQSQSPHLESNEDRISGANLKLLLEAMRHKTSQEVNQPLPPSGVEEILEPIKAAPKDCICSSDKCVENTDALIKLDDSTDARIEKAKKED